MKQAFAGSSALIVHLILAGYVLLAAIHSVIVPLWENPDEPEHVLYVRHIAAQRALPQEPLLASFTENDESGQAPLYYVIAAAVVGGVDMSALDSLRLNPHRTWVGDPAQFAMFEHTLDEAWPWRGVVIAAHLLRFLSIVFGGLTLLGVYFVAKAAFPRDPAIAVLAMALTAFNPGFIASTSSVSNDSLVALASTLVLALVCFAITRRQSSLLALSIGASLGIALLSKANALLLVPFALAPSLMLPRLRARIGHWLMLLSACVAVSGWWYLWNWWVFGTPIRKEADRMIVPESGWESTLTLHGIGETVRAMFRSFWGFVGWTDVHMDSLVYVALACFSVLCVFGFVRMEGGRRRDSANGLVGANGEAAVLLLLGLTGALFGLVVFYRGVITPWPGVANARFLLPAVSAIATLLAAGWLELARKVTVRWVSLIPVAGLAILAAIAPLVYIRPAYPAPLPVWRGSIDIANPLEVPVRLGDDISLVAFDSPPMVQPGGSLPLRLFWRAERKPDRDYTAFVHLLASDGSKMTQDDRIAVDDYPTERWASGETVMDERILAIPASAPSGNYRLAIGMYSSPSLQRLPVTVGGQLSADGLAVIGAVLVQGNERTD